MRKRLIITNLLMSTILMTFAGHWTFNPHEYRYDMTVYAQLTVDGKPVDSYEDYELAAIVDTACRGVAVPITIDDEKSSSTYSYLMIRVYSNQPSNEMFVLQCYRPSTNEVLPLWGIDPISFVADGVEGTPSSPMLLSLNKRHKADVNGDGLIDVADLNCIINVILVRESGNSFITTADVDGDGQVDITDINGVINAILNSH